MNETAAPTTNLPVPGDPEGDVATSERTEPRYAKTDLHKGDFAAGERTEPEVAGSDPESDLHGDFAAGERTEAIAPADADEGTFADTTD